MANNYTLWIVSPPPDLIWSHVFDEVALGLQSAFNELGFEVPIVTDPMEIHGRAIVFGANLAPMYKIELPVDCIIFNLEQVHPESRWFQPDYGYIDLLKKYPVWDFSTLNTYALQQMGIGNVIHCSIGYAPVLTHIRRRKEDVDVLFIGGGHPRRQKIFDDIIKQGAKFHQVYKIFGKERDDWIARGKIHINLHKEPAKLFEIVRVSYLLANRCFVISETGADTEMEGHFKDALVFCGYDQMVERCLHYLVHPKERKRIAEAGFELIQKMPQKEFLANALEDHYRVHGKRALKSAKSSLLSFEVPKPTIFVAIASYRDPECQHTVANLFRRAKYPERIHVGICLQADPELEKDCLVDLKHRSEQIRITQYHWNESEGANWARDKALRLMDGEEYVLMIDSHMRFEAGWDESLMEMLARCPSEKPILSTYCSNYDPPNKRSIEPEYLLRVRVRGVVLKNNIRLLDLTGIHVPVSPADERLGLYPTPFGIANCMFARASVFKEVPLDPHIHFWGDEMNYAARLWTHGYDIFQHDRVVMYHYWARMDKFHLHHYRDHETPQNLRSIERVNHLLGFEKAKNADALVEIDNYGLGQKRALDGLWTFAGIDWINKTVTPDAEEGRWNMKERDKALAKEKFDDKPAVVAPDTKGFAITNGAGKQPKIFINIASYRDPECQWTVKDLFEKAKHPERINVGICWQFDSTEDQHCFEVTTRPEQVRIFPVDWREAEGVCWARHHTQQLWDGEDYTLMTDSHMRFVPGWDELMINELAACEADKPLLSCSPAAYEPPDKLGHMMKPTFRRVRPFTTTGNMRCQAEALDRSPPKPLNGAFVVCNFIFSKSAITAEVPYDPYLYFDQEEITYSARLYTHGWDVFSARKQFLYHYYNTNERSVRPLHWTDLRKEDDERIRFFYDRGLKRFNHMTRHQLSNDPGIIMDLDKYGFGKVRSLEQFEDYTGIDFKNKKASDKALRGLFIKDLAKYRDHPVRVPEIDDAKPAVNTPETTVPPKEMLPVAALSKSPRELTTMPEPGDFIPLFHATDTNNSVRAIELYAGKHTILVFLPLGNPDTLKMFFEELQKQIDQAKLENIWQIFIMGDTVQNLNIFKQHTGVKHSLWADPEGKLARSFGLSRHGEDVSPTAFVLCPNLRVIHRHLNKGPLNLAAAVVSDCSIAVQEYKQKNKEQRVISELPPVLIVPNVLSPELCQKCIRIFKEGHTFEGTVGANKATGYRPDTKVRTDHIVGGALLEELDYKLSRSFFPEIKKIFGCEITYRELYKIGLYTGDKKGFFRQHRDNLDAPLGYRRIASTIHLSDDYEGGGLRFPEYDDHIYRPKLGSGIAFSCSTLHEARPVTKGERYVLVGFFHGDEDEAYRRHYAISKGEPLKLKEYTPKLHSYPEINQSRDFYKEWREKNVHIHWEDKDSK